MRELIKQTVTNGNFFEVVDCPKGNPWECDLGTFYVTLSVGNLRAEDYESLPKLVVRNGATGDEIKTVVLPYSNYKLYVPLRLFKAIATARGLAHFSMGGQEDIDGLINQPNDAGLMSTKTKQELGAKKLGMCDSGSCSARTNPGTATSGGMDKPCPSDNQTSTAITINLTGVSGISTTSYNANFTENGPKPPGSPNSGPEVLKKIIEQDVCKKVADAETSTYYVNGTDFVTQGTSPSGCGNNSKIELKQADTIKTATKQLTIVQGANTFPQTIPPGPPSYCAELDETKTVVAIEDQSENYRVKKNTPMIYRLNLTQSFADEKIKDPPLTGNPPVPGNAGWKCTSEEKMVTTGIGIDWVGNTCNP
jgi:hypothetical protein